MRLLGLITVLFLATGCHWAQTRTYDVSVYNASKVSITIWLTKDGEPYENGWLSPEDLVLESPKNKGIVLAGVVVPPGKTAYTGPKQGKFDSDTSAILRIYDGQLKLNDILAVGRDSALRIDLPLPVGTSSWNVSRDEKGLIQVNPFSAP